MPIRGSELNPPVQLEILSFIKSSDFLPTASDLQFLTGGEAVGSTNGHFASRRKKKNDEETPNKFPKDIFGRHFFASLARRYVRASIIRW